MERAIDEVKMNIAREVGLCVEEYVMPALKQIVEKTAMDVVIEIIMKNKSWEEEANIEERETIRMCLWETVESNIAEIVRRGLEK